jgi:erythromycin esterase
VQAQTTPYAQNSRLYAQLDAALENQRPDDALGLAHPDAMVQHGAEQIRFTTAVAQLKQVLQNGATVKQRTAIVSLRVDETGARTVRRSDVSVTLGGQTRTGTEESEDTWVRTPDGWRLKLVRALGAVEKAPAPAHGTNAVVKEIQLHARALDDLDAICNAIGEARVVALGEATHGTSEFSDARARIVEHLAARKGFTVLAVEDNWAEAAAIDNYIKTGNGSPEGALAQLKGWPFRTREMLELIEAMRAVNTKSPGKMTFAGFDMT